MNEYINENNFYLHIEYILMIQTLLIIADNWSWNDLKRTRKNKPTFVKSADALGFVLFLDH